MEYKQIPLAEIYISFQEMPYHNRLFITDTVTTEAMEPVEHAIEQNGASFHVGKCISVTLQFWVKSVGVFLVVWCICL